MSSRALSSRKAALRRVERRGCSERERHRCRAAYEGCPERGFCAVPPPPRRQRDRGQRQAAPLCGLCEDRRDRRERERPAERPPTSMAPAILTTNPVGKADEHVVGNFNH